MNNISAFKPFLNLFMLVLFVFDTNHLYIPSFQQNPSTQNTQYQEIIINSEFKEVSSEIINAIKVAIYNDTSDFSTGTIYQVTSVNIQNDWGRIYVIPVKSSNIEENLLYVKEVLIHYEGDQWTIGIEGSEDYYNLVSLSPESLVSLYAKNVIFPRHSSTRTPSTDTLQSTVIYKFPWANGSSWEWWKRNPPAGYPTWHGPDACKNGQTNPEPERCAIDLGTWGDKTVLASATGTGEIICESTHTYNIRITDESNVLLDYYHIDKYSVSNEILQKLKSKEKIIGGTSLGKAHEGYFSDNCGYAQQKEGSAHVHLVFPAKPFVIDGWTFDYPNLYATNGDKKQYVSSNFLSSNVKCPSPEPTQIALFTNSAVNQTDKCGGKGEREGFLFLNPPSVGDPFLTDSTTFPIGSIKFPTSCPAPALPLEPTQRYRIKSSASQLMVDVNGGSQNDNAAIIQWESHGASNQRWLFIPRDSKPGYYWIKSISSQKCMSVDSNHKVIQRTCESSSILNWLNGITQEWKLTPNNGSFFIQEASQDWALTISNPGKWGEQLTTFPLFNGTNQSWEINRLDLFVQVTNQAGASVYIFDDQPDLRQTFPWLFTAGSSFNIKVGRFNEPCYANQQGLSPDILGSSSCIPNSPPNAPALTSPGQNSSSLNTAPTLCWQSRGDPDNNVLEYKVDIFDSQHNTSSGWTTNTCWQPSELNYQYDTYQWHVKARDPLLAESNWSETRSFRIEAPNKPPSISFNAANSNTASTILSREGTWTFTGTASDPEGDLRSIEFKCTGFSCGTTTSHTNGNNWSHTQTGLNGENSIQFIAHDGYPNHSYSRKVTLLIDQAPPTTQISLDGKAVGGSLANWYTAPVQVNLKATDGGIGKALAGVKLIRYRLDSDVDHWTEVSGDNAAFVVNTDGTHTLDVYSEDQLGNAKTEARLTFKIDQTPPPAPSGTLETNGALDATWQNTGNLPGFTWDASVDATSGLWGYQLYFGSDPAGIGYQDIPASQPREWTPMPGGVPTGTYYLRGRARDFAGNWSAWTTMFTYRYDGTPPENPANVTHAKAVESTVWQRVTSMPNFFWSVPEDKGSGIQGYLYYWGMEEDGTGTELLTDPRYSSPDGLCPDSACTGYLRLRSLDNVGNQAGEWTTAYVLRYDNAPPTVDFTINGGEGYTSQTQITLNITASDLGSGVKALRFSRDNLTWYDWESFTPTIEVTIPPISRTSWPVYIQVKDGVGNVSEIIRHEVALDVNKEQSQSESFRLFDYAQVAGSGELDSANFDSHGTLGQPLEAPITSSENFVNASGYEGGSQAAPVIVPGYETFTTINGAFVTGNGVSIMVSSSFRMMGATGETALPNNEPNLTSAGFSHQPGFLAAAPSIKLAPEKTAGTPPEPEPQPECTLPSVVINNGAAFTNQADVTLALCAPNAVEMLIANSQDMTGAVPQPYAREISWQLDSVTQEVQARFVYVIFKDAAGNAFGAYMDDITFDQTVPSGALLLSDDVPAAQVAFERWLLSQPDNVEGDQAYMEFASLQTANDYVQSNPDGSINLMVDAMDNNSGLVEMQFSDTADFTGMAWEAFAPVKTLTLPDTTDGQKIVYARFRDSAGNISEPALISFLVDRRTPYGSAWFEHNTVQPDVRQINLEMFAGDDFIDEDSGELIEAGSGVAEMRIGLQPDLSDAAWQPFVTPVSWPVELAESYSGTVYVQFRDLAGNESEITNAGYQVDLAAPQLYASLYQGSSNTHQLIVDAWDDLGPVKTLYISNDPLMENDVVAVDYMGEAIDWTFDSQQVVWIAAEDMAGNRSASYPVQAGSVAGQQVQMTWGWNLVSFAVEPTSPNIKSALETIDQSYDLVLSETGVFATSLPEAANSLTQLHAGSAYYIRRTGYTNTSARIAGQLVDPQTPIQLHQGWNWVGYLPGSSMPVTDALASIAGKYSLVHSLDLTFSPDEPVFSTLTSMEPGQGYLIYMNADGVLTYPTPPAAQSPLRPQQIEAEAEETALAATPYFTVIYGQININGQPAPAGTQVQVVTPRGEVAGTFTITNPGIMGYTHIYGVPESETGGFHEGEELQFIVNGMNVEPSTPMVWSDDHDTHAFQLSFNHLLLYMPFVKK